MNTYILNDAQNLFYRQIKMTNPKLGIDNMISMALHMILHSMKKEFNNWNGTHAVMFLEGRSWRKNVYPDYKANRKVAMSQMTEEEQENHRILSDAFSDFIEYVDQNTNITVLRNPGAEADDMINIWIEAHPNDQHVLISSDSDFFQLLRYPGVVIYDPVKDILIKRDGVYNERGQRLSFVLDGKAKIKAGAVDENFVCEPEWYNYALFLKCVRGDQTDNIFSAYPGVREKGTKKTVGIMEAYQDRSTQGYNWNNFMLQKWTDHNGQEHRVKDRYEFNRLLIDLSQIPSDVRDSSLSIIAEKLGREPVPALHIGMSFMKFCGNWKLNKIGDHSQDFFPLLKSKYNSR